MGWIGVWGGTARGGGTQHVLQGRSCTVSEFQHQFEWQGGLVTGAEWEGERGQGRPLRGAHRLLFFFSSPCSMRDLSSPTRD